MITQKSITINLDEFIEISAKATHEITEKNQ